MKTKYLVVVDHTDWEHTIEECKTRAEAQTRFDYWKGRTPRAVWLTHVLVQQP